MDMFSELEYGMSYELPVSYEEFLFDLEECIFGQDEELKGIAYDIYTFLQGAFKGNIVKHNFILAGPSASGKTELYRTLKRLFQKYGCPVPVIHLDITSFSPTGFQGEELNAIPEKIFNEDSDGLAIVFLDEFDKILSPLHCSNGDNINGILQHELLTLIEGRVCTNKQRNMTHSVDTSKTLFIGMGAFTSYRKEQTEKKTLGFLSSPEEEKVPEQTLLAMEDLHSVGGMIELLGRFDNIYNFQPIARDFFDSFFERLIEDLSIEQQVLIKTTEDAIDSFFELTRSKYGCREIKRVLYRTIKPQLIEMVNEKLRQNFYILVKDINQAELCSRMKKL